MKLFQLTELSQPRAMEVSCQTVPINNLSMMILFLVVDLQGPDTDMPALGTVKGWNKVSS